MSYIKNRVIIWSVDNYNSLAMIRAIGKDGIDVFFLVKGKAGYAAKSKYCNAYVEKSSVEECYQYLMTELSSNEVKPIILTAGDDIIAYIDAHRDEMRQDFIIPGSTIKGNIEKYNDKYNMTLLAQEVGIVCPKSHLIKWDSCIDDIVFPCVIKPSHQRPGHYNEFKYKICRSKKALQKLLKLVHHDSVFIVQQYIETKEEALVYGSRMYDGNTVIAGAIVRDRSSSSGTSHGSISNIIPKSISTDCIRKFLEKIDYYGLFSFEYGLYDNKAYFFEVNLRNDATSNMFFQAGANIPLSYVYSAAGDDYSKVPNMVDSDRYFIDDIFDYENVIRGKITREQWKEDKANATAFKYYDEDDIEPYTKAMQTRNKELMQSIVLSKFRPYVVYVLDRLGLRK